MGRERETDLCKYVLDKKTKKRCLKSLKKRSINLCPCACSDYITITKLPSCPAGPIDQFDGESCANIRLTCQYDSIDKSCDQVVSEETCDCKPNGQRGVDNIDLQWQCVSLDLDPCPDPQGSSAPSQAPRRKT